MPELSLTQSKIPTSSHKSFLSSRYSTANGGNSCENEETISSTIYYSDNLNNHESSTLHVPQLNQSKALYSKNRGLKMSDMNGSNNSIKSNGLSKFMNQTIADLRSATIE